jgi:hypothetical protein
MEQSEEKREYKFRCGCIETPTELTTCPNHKDSDFVFVIPHRSRSGYVTGIYDKEDCTGGVEYYFALHTCTYDEKGFLATISRQPLTEQYYVASRSERTLFDEKVKSIINDQNKFLEWQEDIGTMINRIPQEYFTE